MARWLSDGNIEFLGRLDYQVKIRGLRIELGEIEQVLASHDAVRDCVAAVKKYSENIVIIAAYIIKKAEVQPQDLKNYLKKSLPDYMIPNTYIFMDRFPTTPAGKLDRQALPEPQF
jgi:acyl-coenzyme A synthetase/AMP-(fatty) acid ligase